VHRISARPDEHARALGSLRTYERLEYFGMGGTVRGPGRVRYYGIECELLIDDSQSPQRITASPVHHRVTSKMSCPAGGHEKPTFQGVHMRRINIAAFSLMLFAAASAPVMAQGGGAGGGGMRMDPAQMATRSSDRLMTGITLSAAQTESVKKIDATFADGMKAAMGGSDARTQMTALRTKQQTDLRAVLTADQQTTFDKNVADMEKARANRTPRP
jgi:hypothetical protein